MTYPTKMIGVLRFSLLSTNYYSDVYDTPEAKAEHLFSEERMALRFHLFQHLCLPTLTRQTDPDFACVILASESMPQVYMDLLRDMIAPYEQLRLLVLGIDKQYKLMKEAYASVDPGEDVHRILFRLDDDDAVDLDYVARTKQRAQHMLQMTGGQAPFVISYNRGFYIRRGEEENEVFDACERMPLSIGVVVVAPPGFDDNPYRVNHRSFPQYYTTLQDLEVPAFIRTIHGDNKSNPALSGLSHRMRRRPMKEALQQHFGFTLHRLKAI